MRSAVQASEASATKNAARERATLLAVAESYLRFALREPARFQVMFGPSLGQDEVFESLEQAINFGFFRPQSGDALWPLLSQWIERTLQPKAAEPRAHSTRPAYAQ